MALAIHRRSHGLNTLVLVGYAAKDTAMRLLLETLDADRERFREPKNVYAINARLQFPRQYEGKGIRPLEFGSDDEIHETLAEWAVYDQGPRGYASSRVNRISVARPS